MERSPSGWTLGQTSARYETGGRGPGTVSTGRGDHGGVSYGSYQLSTNEGAVQAFLRFNPEVGAEFARLTPGSEAFSRQWVAKAEADPQGFHAAQHAFIQSTYYDRQVKRLQDVGIDLSDRGPAVQDMLWSTAVQFQNRTRSIVNGALQGQELSTLSDVDIVSKVQDYKRDHNNRLFASSPKLWPGLLARAANEKSDLVELAREYGGDLAPADVAKAAPGTSADALQQASSHPLSPQSRRLVDDCEQWVHGVCERHRLPWDQGMDNTVLSVAAQARQQGMTQITHLGVENGQIRFAQWDGARRTEGQLEARAAANTRAEDSLGRMAELDQRPEQAYSPTPAGTDQHAPGAAQAMSAPAMAMQR